MPQYVALGSWTDQGIRSVKDSIKRAESAQAMARKLGGKMQILYTMGEYDTVALIEMPSDEAYNRLMLSLGALGNVRTKSLKAWTQDEMRKTVDQM